jgi:hypothetical protein
MLFPKVFPETLTSEIFAPLDSATALLAPIEPAIVEVPICSVPLLTVVDPL